MQIPERRSLRDTRDARDAREMRAERMSTRAPVERAPVERPVERVTWQILAERGGLVYGLVGFRLG